MTKRLLYYLLLCVLCTLAASCSTQKAKWGNIRYHNTACHYNVWWNGNESLKEGREKLYKSAVDDYTRLLPVEPLGTPDNARSINPEMDRAIEKGVKGIKKHSIFVGGEEHVPYIKECYLLTAYASFYKQDYISAVNTCNILINQFDGTRAGDEGSVLLARCLSADHRYLEAEAALDQLMSRLASGSFSRSQRDKLYIAMVEATLAQGKYKKAVDYIHLAIESTSDRSVKARLYFILAQIYQELNRRPVAAKYYHKVLSYGPDYVMEFNARLGEASCADLQHSDIDKLERQLDRMLQDRKNTEYLDQIYFAKGEMYMGMKDATRACDNYRRSCAVSTTNRSQKARSAIRLADVLYDLYEDYDQAQIYYDTAMALIDKNYPNYKAVQQRHNTLTELVSFTRVFQRNDSLMRVATMPEDERLAFIQAMIDTLIQQEERAHEKALLDEILAESKEQDNTLTGDWYFYNKNSVQKGKEAFRKKWGMRILEDYWAISDHNFTSLAFEDDTIAVDNEAIVEDDTLADTTITMGKEDGNGDPNDPHSIAYYLKDLPSTPHAVDSLDSLNSLSLLGAGYIYYDAIHNVPRALECYLRMAKDYTTYDEIVQAFYMLYIIYDRQGNSPQADYYRDMVLMGFPDSDFANLVRDNEYYKEILARDQRVDDDYAEVYDLYSRRRYASVIRLVDQAEEYYVGNPALPKFRFWKSLALAQRGNMADAITVMENVVAVTPSGDSLNTLAKAQLAMLHSDSLRFYDSNNEAISERDEERVQKLIPGAPPDIQSKPDDDLPPESLVYRYRENQQYYVIVVVDDRRIKATELQYRLADFNSQYYSNLGYKVNALLFTDTSQLITIHRFKNSDEALGYYHHLQQDESPLRRYPDTDHTEFIISTQNYATFYNRKNIDAYLAFFRKYYIQ